VVLAAGRARRFGGAKLLAPLRGRPVLAHVLDLLARAADAGIVASGRIVVAADDAGVADLVSSAGVETIVNQAPERGLSSSLRCGLAALGSDTGAAVIVLGDQPLVRLEVLEALVAAWRDGRGSVIRPRYADAPGEPGHPVLLDRSVWPLAGRLEGDAGFGVLFPAGSAGVALIDVAGRNPDVDTPADLDTLQGSWP
jgi:CTP:molybdopterin cytidylyltransferase MocA